MFGFSPQLLPEFDSLFPARFREKYCGRAQFVSTIQIDECRAQPDIANRSCLPQAMAKVRPKSGLTNDEKSQVSRNRLQLRRTIEEAEGYRELGMMDHALRTLQKRGALVHGNGHACFLLGETLRDMARYEEALLPLERSADLVPDDIHVFLALGWCYKRTGQLARAIESLEKAVRVDASEAILHYNLACYWSLARNRTLALKYLARALEIDSNFRDMIASEADFNPLRHDPEFKQLTGVSVEPA